MKKRIAILLLAFVLFLPACGQQAPTWQEQYDLGVRYISEGNYQEAIIAFTVAIKIDPKRAEAYGGLAEAYRGQGDVDNERATLQKGYDVTGAEELLAKLENLPLADDAEILDKEDIIHHFLSQIEDGTLEGELIEADVSIFVNRLVPEYEAAYQELDDCSINPFGVSLQNAVSLTNEAEILVSEAALDWRSQNSVFNYEVDLFSPEETPQNWREVHGNYVNTPLHTVCILAEDKDFQEIQDEMFYPNGPYSICVVWFETIQ